MGCMGALRFVGYLATVRALQFRNINASGKHGQ